MGNRLQQSIPVCRPGTGNLQQAPTSNIREPHECQVPNVLQDRSSNMTWPKRYFFHTFISTRVRSLVWLTLPCVVESTSGWVYGPGASVTACLMPRHVSLGIFYTLRAAQLKFKNQCESTPFFLDSLFLLHKHSRLWLRLSKMLALHPHMTSSLLDQFPSHGKELVFSVTE